MEISQEIFEHFCPVALSSDNGIFNSVSDSIAMRKTFITEVTGNDIYDDISGICSSGYSPTDQPEDNMQRVARKVVRYICVAALADAVPHLDLVLTDTGFGVVSNANVAPASSERVERLLSQLTRLRDDNLDAVISSLRNIDGWSESEYASRWIPSIFWNGDHARLFGRPSATRSTLDELAPQITDAESWLKEVLSPEFYWEMCLSERSPETPELNREAVWLARNCVVAHVNNLGSLERHKRVMLRFIEAFPDNFGTYIASSAYRANHFEPYENKKDDSCFFFG